MYAGHWIPGFIRLDTGGRAALGHPTEMVAAKRRVVAESVVKYRAYWEQFDVPEEQRIMIIDGLGCPVAAQMHLLAAAFLRVHTALAATGDRTFR
jgi:hypothetical protein